MSRHAIWATALVLAIAAIAYHSSQYEIEAAKQRAFMFKVCVDAGGQFDVSWSVPLCRRPQEAKP